MSKLIFFTIVFLLALVLNVAGESTRLARHRHRILHHRYPQTFRHKPSAEEENARSRSGYRPNGYQPSQTFELPNERRQPWSSLSNARMRGKVPQYQQHRRPVDIYGSPPVNWPIRPPPLGRPRQPSPHDIYGPPAELPSSADDDISESGGFRDDYEYEQYPEEDGAKGSQQSGVEQQKPNAQKSEQYVDTAQAEAQRKEPKDDKIENFEIPLELLRGPQRYEAV